MCLLKIPQRRASDLESKLLGIALASGEHHEDVKAEIVSKIPLGMHLEFAPDSLISLNRGSFDVIVGIDWLSKRKFVIVCHEKVVEIPLEGSRKLRVQRERTLGAAKALMNARKEQVKLRRVRAMAMTIQYGVRGMILAAQSEAFKQENV
ncbi:hypothetical protein Tco_1456729 [Tanacetum coccineum]